MQGLSDARRARFAILGFASFQACVISLLYMGSNCSFSFGNLELERGELLFPLLFMVCMLAACAFAPNSARARLLSAPVIIASSLLMVAGSLAPTRGNREYLAWWHEKNRDNVVNEPLMPKPAVVPISSPA